MASSHRIVAVAVATAIISYFTVGSNFFIQLSWLVSAYTCHYFDFSHYIFLAFVQWIGATALIGMYCWKWSGHISVLLTEIEEKLRKYLHV